MLWCNALTEWYNAENETGYSPVYHSDSGYDTPIRSVDDTTSVPDPLVSGEQDDPYVDPNADGFRLLTTDEWELAARWRDEDTNTVTGYENPWFTRGNSASGATADYENATATKAVAWYNANSSSTHAVKGKAANALGLYDMSGNVYEYCFDWETSGSFRVIMGGSYAGVSKRLRIGNVRPQAPFNAIDFIGFRFARTP